MLSVPTRNGADYQMGRKALPTLQGFEVNLTENVKTPCPLCSPW